MAEWDAIGIGLAVRDVSVLLESYPAPDEKVQARAIVESGGGPVPTALVTLARLGRKTALAAIVGRDDVGRFILSGLERQNVDTRAVVEREGFSSPTSVIVVENGRRTILEAPHGVGLPLTFEDVGRLPLDDCRALLLDARSVEVQLEAAKRVRKASGLVVLDCGHPREGVDELLAHTDIAVLSHTYPATLYGPDYDVEEFLDSLLARLPADGPAIAGLTLGPSGCAIASRDVGLTRLAGLSVAALDTTGAGDVFHGAFLHAFLKTGSPDRAARFANAAAARKCEGMTGRAPLPSEEELWAHSQP